MKSLRFVVLIILVVVVGVANFVRQAKFKEAGFHGKLVAKEKGSGLSRSSRKSVVMLLEAADGTQTTWTTPESKANYYRIGDYLVKPAGKKYPAVFRDGKQLLNSGVPYFLDEEIALSLYAGATAAAPGERDDGGPPTAAELPQTTSERPFGAALEPPPAPSAAQPATAQPGAASAAAAPAPGSEEAAQALLAEAAKLWEKRDYNGSIAKSEEALKIRIALYGENHYLVVDVRRRITIAQQRMAAQ